MTRFGYFKLYGDLDDGVDLVKVLGILRQEGITVSMDVALYKAD